MFHFRWARGVLIFFLLLLLLGGQNAVLGQTECYREQRDQNGDFIRVRWPIDTIREITFRIDDTVPSEWHKPIQSAAASWNIALRNAGVNLQFKLTPDPGSSNVISTIHDPEKKNEYIAAAPVVPIEANGVFLIQEARMIFNTAWEFTTKNERRKLDVQGIATHEFGHWLGLGDLKGELEAFRCRNRTVMVHLTLLLQLWSKLDSNESTRYLRIIKNDDIKGLKIFYNRPPTANAGHDLVTIVDPTIWVFLDGTASFDPDGDRLSFLWSILPNQNSARCRFGSGSTRTVSSSRPTIQALQAGSCTVRLIVNDGKVNSAPDEVVITAFLILNEPPIANAGPDQTVQVGSRVELNARGSTDPNGDKLICRWRMLRKPSRSRATPTPSTIRDCTNPNTAQATFVADKVGDYLLELVVDDGRGGTATDQVKITAERVPADLFIIFAASSNICNPTCNWDIYRMNLNGTGIINLTNNPAYLDIEPIGSPDRGKKIAFISHGRPDCPTSLVSRPCLYIMESDGRKQRKLVGCEDPCWRITNPRFSPDGSEIIFERSCEISITSIDGTNLRDLTSNGTDPCEMYPVFTPDGQKIVFIEGVSNEIFIMNRDGTNPQKLTNTSPSFSKAWMDVSPEGNQIVFTGWNEQPGGDDWFEIYIMDIDGTNMKKLTNTPGVADVRPKFSPDGRKIVFRSGQDIDIFIMNRDGSNVQQLTKTPNIGEEDPAFLFLGIGLSPRSNSPEQLPVQVRLIPKGLSFQCTAQGEGAVRLSIFDLSGRLIFHTDWVENGFEWNLLNDRGQRLANGVYLYVVTVRGWDGTIIRSEVKKLVILR